ncbi:MAG: hypothetical protein Q9222_001607 [Ikaeria aurantiellina]
MDRGSLNNLTAIAKHPIHRHNVKTVQLFGPILADHLISIDDYEAILRSSAKPSDYFRSDYDMLAFDSRGQPLLTARRLKEGYEEYVQALEAQTEALVMAGSSLAEAFTMFDRLCEVSTCSLDGYEASQPAKFDGTALRILDPFLGSLWGQLPYPAQDAFVICQAVSKLQHSLERFHLTHDPYCYDYHLLQTTVQELEAMSLAFQKSREFSISLNAAESEEFLFGDDPFPAFGFLDRAPSLDCMNITAISINLAAVLGDVYWPSLTTLRLYSLFFAQGNLRSLLRSIRQTLKVLTLYDVTLTEGCWFGIFQDLQKHHLEDESLSIEALNCMDWDGSLLGEHTDVSQDSLIKAFVCQGKEWSSELPEWLSEQE